MGTKSAPSSGRSFATSMASIPPAGGYIFSSTFNDSNNLLEVSF